MELVGNEFMGKLKYLYKSWWPARDLVKEAIAKRFEVRVSSFCLQVWESLYIKFFLGRSKRSDYILRIWRVSVEGALIQSRKRIRHRRVIIDKIRYIS